MPRKVTLADVAAAAGVSKMTASRAMRGAKDVSQKNLDKVRKAAQDIGYVGNHVAASLSNNRSDLIGVVVPSLSNIVFSEVMSGIERAIDGTGFQPVFGVTDYDTEKEYDIVRRMLSWRPAGLIVTGLDQSEATLRLLQEDSLPVVQIMDTDGTPVDVSVGFSQDNAAEEMAKALVAAGRRRIGYVGCNLDHDTRAARRRVRFSQTLEALGHPLAGEEIAEGMSSVAAGRWLTSALLARHPDLDCIYYSNDDMAAGGLFHCMAYNIKVSEKLMLAGFNGLDLLTSLPAPIATTRTPRDQIGRCAAEAILERLNRTERDGPTVIELAPEIRLP